MPIHAIAQVSAAVCGLAMDTLGRRVDPAHSQLLFTGSRGGGVVQSNSTSQSCLLPWNS